MSQRHACVLVLGLLALPALAQTTPERAAEPAASATAQAADATPPEGVPTTVVVEGRRPGPGVWKVSKGEHVMWVFGTYTPLPAKMEWDSARVERLVAHSQEVLLPPSANAHVGFWRGLTLLPSLIGIKKNPDGAQLHDVLPADVYARWATLKAQYIGKDDDVEYERPMFASDDLLHASRKKNGLVYGNIVLRTIEEVAKRSKVKVSQTGYQMTLDDPRKTIKEFKKSPVDDVACFTKTLDSMDADLDTVRARANAWANGDIAAIRSVNYMDRENACNDAILKSAFAKDNADFQQIGPRLQAAWLKTAEQSLADNTSTFAILQMKDILDPKGYLAALQARGYTVESPK